MSAEPYVRDLADDTAFERYVLECTLPLVTVKHDVITGRYDVADDRMDLQVRFQETLGMSTGQAVERLSIRPLCFGAAWKVLDLLVEYGLAAAGIQPENSKRWTIKEKTKHTMRAAGQAAPLSPNADVWSRLTRAYAGTEQVRHSLIHRRARVTAAGDIRAPIRAGSPSNPFQLRNKRTAATVCS